MIVEDLVPKTLPVYEIDIGVISGKSKKRKDEGSEKGLTNAEILFINENGSPLRGIPARPVLEKTIHWIDAEIAFNGIVDKISEKYIDSDYDDELLDKEVNKFCLRIQNHARQLIYDNNNEFEPNAPSVAKRKGGNHPLFNTGQLARSIVAVSTRK